MPSSTWTNLDPGRQGRVLDAAMAEFGRRGYFPGSLNTVAREAGVAKGSLFQYFSDKLELFGFVVEQASRRVLDAMRPWLAEPPPGRAFTAHVVDGVFAWFDYFSSHPYERGVISAANFEMDSDVRAACPEPVHLTYVASLRPMIEAARERGELRPDADVDTVVALLVLLLHHLALAPYVAGPDPVLGDHAATLDQLRHRLTALVTSMLGATVPAPSA